MSAQKLWLIALASLLAGYAVAGKGFAYLGVKPLLVGEAVLAFGLIIAVMPKALRSVWRSPMSWLWLAFASWGAIRTLPYLGQYGIVALRDATIWGYGIFALLVAAFLFRCFRIEEVVQSYGRFALLLVLWLPIGFLLQWFANDLIPNGPGTGIPILWLKASDICTHLAGSAAFMLLRLSSSRPGAPRTTVTVKELVFWCCWFIAAGTVGATNRGGLLSVVITIILVLACTAQAQRRKFVFLTLIVLVVIVAVNPELDLPGSGRKASIRQLTANLTSVWSPETDEALDGTRQWRLQWWDEILGYTISGDHFWTGKGYGINLADDDGFQVTNDDSLRSPHNGHLTILARSGVPGFGLWILLQLAFVWNLIRAYRRAKALGQDWIARVDLWVLAYWTAFMVNTSFDVFLEGPQSGIWFWSILGFGIALVQFQRQWLHRAAGLPIGVHPVRTATAARGGAFDGMRPAEAGTYK